MTAAERDVKALIAARIAARRPHPANCHCNCLRKGATK